MLPNQVDLYQGQLPQRLELPPRRHDLGLEVSHRADRGRSACRRESRRAGMAWHPTPSSPLSRFHFFTFSRSSPPIPANPSNLRVLRVLSGEYWTTEGTQAWRERDQGIKGEGRRTESVAIGVICGSVRGPFPARRDARGSDSTSGIRLGGPDATDVLRAAAVHRTSR